MDKFLVRKRAAIPVDAAVASSADGDGDGDDAKQISKKHCVVKSVDMEILICSPEGCCVTYQPKFLDADETRDVFSKLRKQVLFEQKTIQVWGRPCQQHRLIAYYGDEGCLYRYSGLTLEPRPWLPELRAILIEVNELTKGRFNSCLLNYYRDGSDYISFHADNEKELGDGGCVATVSLGAARKLVFRRCSDKAVVEKILDAGSLVVMNGSTQQHWQHSLPVTKQIVGPRISLTFRQIRPQK